MATEIYDDPRIIEFDVRTDEMLVNMGPQHPSTHGVLRLVLRTDGEIVSETTPHIGYLHRCAEKIGENLTPRQWIPYTDRMDYLAGMNMNLGWALTVEKLMKLELPEKAKHLRVIIAEMGRIASHLVGMGAYGLDLGTFSPFLYAFREREKILDLFEEACGARLTYSYLTVGGATADLPPGWLAQVREVSRPAAADHHRISRAADDQRHLHPPHGGHRRDVGRDGDRLRLHRPGAARQRRRSRPASRRRRALHRNVRRLRVRSDRREERPLSATTTSIRRCPASAVLGDCWHRFYVRMLEVMQSIDLVRQAIDRYSTATGSWGEPVKLAEKLPKGEAYLETEAPRGQMGFYIVSLGGAPIPWRARARSSCFCNLSVTHELCRGCLIADVPAIVGSLDIVMGEIDR